jgi:hypothetical protein
MYAEIVTNCYHINKACLTEAQYRYRKGCFCTDCTFTMMQILEKSL